MEHKLSDKMTPIFKCIVLFLLVFTAKVLTSQPNEGEDSKNNIQHTKPSHYVRTFTKYHHRRTQSPDWHITSEQPKTISKRSVEIPDSNSFAYKGVDEAHFSQFSSDFSQENFIAKSDKGSKDDLLGKNGLDSDAKKYKVKAAIIVKDPPKVFTPGISCLYKIKSVSLSVTPSYDDESNMEEMVENERFDTPGVISEKVLPSGEAVQVEQCTEPRATCYILWHLGDDGNNTVLGQGCWRGSSDAQTTCDRCTRVSALLPATRFCCCSTDLCNQHYLSLKEEPPQAESTTAKRSDKLNVPNIIAASILALIAIGVLSLAVNKIMCKRGEKRDLSGGLDTEKGNFLGNSDTMATGLTCVDNLTLVEHIGRGKFGSVWRGSLGARPVAVKIYTSPSAWQKERAIYELPYMSHPNLLKYYGSDSRASLTEQSGREYLLVMELSACSVRDKLLRDTLDWRQFAHLAHGLASALAYLHSHTKVKPCIVHRDINSNNVLVSGRGDARLADLGLALAVGCPAETRLTEAGTLRYLSPEALEGALDAGAAPLQAVDVFALALLLWELLSRTRGGGGGGAPYRAPYSEHEPLTLHLMQSLVCRDKWRPPLPAVGPGSSRALRLARDTVADCWDHDADARLTAVCVEERMNELKQIVSTSAPVIHDNIHPQSTDTNVNPPDLDKNSNCLAQNCDVRTPLLLSQPHIGRNPCIERNTHTNITTEVELVHKSLKDISVQSVQNTDTPRQINREQCLSVARVNHNRLLANENGGFNETRSYQRPLEYIPNDVTTYDEIRTVAKDTNLQQDVKFEKSKPWTFKKFFEKKLLNKKEGKPLETEVKLLHENTNSTGNLHNKIMTSIVDKTTNIPGRPSNLTLNENGRLYNMEGPCLSPPNRTLSPTMMIESDMNRENRVFNFKEMPLKDDDKLPQIFAVIVPKSKPLLIENQLRSNSESSSKSGKTCLSSINAGGNSESEDSTFKKRLSADNKIMCQSSNSGRSSRASINLELQYLDNQQISESPFEVNSDFSSSEDEHLMLLSDNGSKITMQTLPKHENINDILTETCQPINDIKFNYQNKYTNFDNEFSDPHDKENLLNTYSGDNPVYLASINGEYNPEDKTESAVKPSIKRQRSLEEVSEIFSSSGNLQLQNPAGRVKTPGDIPLAVRKARRDRVLLKGRLYDSNRLSLYDDRMMFGNSL